MPSVKSQVLALLEENRGSALSGGKIAEKLQVSRAAVWKAVEALRQEGYEISAVTNRGYSLSPTSDRLSPEGIRPYLAEPYRQAELIVYPTVDSTNNAAKRLAMDGAAHGTAVLAEQQTGGKGRRGRSFYSPPGTGLYLTVILKPGRDIQQSLLITAAAAVAVTRALHRLGKIESQIKWVNDIYLNGKKICGILAEAVTNLEDGAIEYVVVGIGVNLVSPPDGFPEELRGNVTSVQEETGVSLSRNQLAGEIISQLLELSAQRDSGVFLEEYRSRSCVLGKTINIFSPRGGIPWHCFGCHPGRPSGRAVGRRQPGNLGFRRDYHPYPWRTVLLSVLFFPAPYGASPIRMVRFYGKRAVELL